MTDDNLSEFLNERVLATRQAHHVQYPVDVDSPVAVMLDSSEDGIAVIILPTIIRDLMHLEIHGFIDGERAEGRLTIPTDTVGVIELTLRRQNMPN